MKSCVKKIILVFGILSIYACAREPVPFNLPLDHPANPRAAEAIFTYPLNPFQEGVTPTAPRSDQVSTTIHEAHETSEGNQPDQHMHQMEMKQEPRQIPSSAIDNNGKTYREKHQ